jgi:hypothetical protein
LLLLQLSGCSAVEVVSAIANIAITLALPAVAVFVTSTIFAVLHLLQLQHLLQFLQLLWLWLYCTLDV